MSSQDTTRRAFLVRAVVGAGSVAGAGLISDASAQNLDQHQDAQAHATGGGHTYFNAQDAATVAAFTERLMPGAPGKPGARDAAVLNYIDLALSGAYAELQDFYRRGLAQLHAYRRP